MKRHPNEKLHHGLASRHFRDVRTTLDRVGLHARITPPHPRILGKHPHIQPTSLDDSKQIQRQRPVIEQTKEPLDIRHSRSPLSAVGFRTVRLARRENTFLHGKPQVAKPRRRRIEAKPEAPKLEAGHLMRRYHLEECEVLFLGRVAIRNRRHVHRRTLAGRSVRRQPPNALLRQLLARGNLHLRAGKRLTVHLHQILDALELDARRKSVQHRLGMRRLQPKVRLPRIEVLLDDANALMEPLPQLVNGHPFERLRTALDEIRHRLRRIAH